MKRIIVLISLVLISFLAISQDDYANPDAMKKTENKLFKPKKIKEKGIKPVSPYFYQGRYMVDFNLGFPNFITVIYRILIEDAIGKKVTTSRSFGPYVIRGDYFTRNKKSFGIDFSYAKSTIGWTQTDTIYTEIRDANGAYLGNTSVIKNNDYKVSVSRFRFVPRVTFHLYGKNNPRINPYLTLGAGFSNYKLTAAPFIPFNVRKNLDGFLLNGRGYVFMARFGTRLHISEKIGLNGEIGFGGPALTFGSYIIF